MNGQTNIIELQDLTKSFPGVLAVDHLSFSVRRGEIFGMVGPDGAGKTTTMRMLAGVLAPDSGRSKGLACGGHPPQETAVFTAPPQNRSCEYSIRCLSIIYRNDNVRFMLTQVPPFTSDLLEEMQIMADQQQATGAISQGIL